MEIRNKEKIYQHSDSLTFSCQYHVLFCPKYRRKVLLGDIPKRLKEIFYLIAKEENFQILDVEVMSDHVHLLLSCNPKTGVYSAIRSLKNRSSHILREEYPELRKKLPSLWTRSSMISTVGEVSLADFTSYLEEQKGR